jgi:hypothetical protein
VARDHEELEQVTTAASKRVRVEYVHHYNGHGPRAQTRLPMGNDNATDITASATGPIATAPPLERRSRFAVPPVGVTLTCIGVSQPPSCRRTSRKCGAAVVSGPNCRLTIEELSPLCKPVARPFIE